MKKETYINDPISSIFIIWKRSYQLPSICIGRYIFTSDTTKMTKESFLTRNLTASNNNHRRERERDKNSDSFQNINQRKYSALFSTFFGGYGTLAMFRQIYFKEPLNGKIDRKFIFELFVGTPGITSRNPCWEPLVKNNVYKFLTSLKVNKGFFLRMELASTSLASIWFFRCVDIWTCLSRSEMMTS